MVLIGPMESNPQSNDQTSLASLEEEEAKGLSIPAWGFILFVIIGGTCFHTWLHHDQHGVYNANQIAMVFFLVLNVLINFWEMGLFAQGDRIHDEYQATKVSYKGRELERVGEVFSKSIPVHKLLSFRQWTGIWSSYALFDPGYAHRGSFGFNVDVCNGWSTILPSILFVFGMTFEVMPARWLGMIGIAMFWQMLYGTAVYFFQFFHAGRHKGHSVGNILLFVGNSNGMWFIFPIWGIWLSVRMVLENSYAMFL